MISSEISDFIDEERKRGFGNTKVYEIELYRRSSEPFTILVLTLIGMAVASRKVRGGMGFHLALGLALGALFIFLSKFTVTFSTNQNLPPVLGVWLPNIVFIFVAIYLVRIAQKIKRPANCDLEKHFLVS